MNESQLREIIDSAIQALETNRDVITPPMLAKLEDMIHQYKNDDTVQVLLATLFNVDKSEVPGYFDKALKVLQVEKDLIFTDKTDTIVQALTKLKGRPIVMKMLAALT